MRREAVNAIALVDFGSTFTKLTITEAGTGRLLAAAQAPTTVETDVMEGYRAALESALGHASGKPRIVRRIAASSAGGGLRVAAIGLVPDYTAQAARQAALNAGARIELMLSGRLDERAVTALEEARPEIVLFSGGTDGGQREQVLENAETLSQARIESRIVVACNRDVAAAVAETVAPRERVRMVANVQVGHDRPAPGLPPEPPEQQRRADARHDALLGAPVLADILDQIEVGVAVDGLLADEHGLSIVDSRHTAT